MLSHESQWSVDRPSEAYGAGRRVIFRKIKHHCTDIGKEKRRQGTKVEKKKLLCCEGEIDLGKVP